MKTAFFIGVLLLAGNAWGQQKPLTCQEEKTKALVTVNIRTQQRNALERDLATQTISFLKLQRQVSRLTKQLAEIKKAAKEKETPKETEPPKETETPQEELKEGEVTQ